TAAIPYCWLRGGRVWYVVWSKKPIKQIMAVAKHTTPKRAQTINKKESIAQNSYFRLTRKSKKERMELSFTRSYKSNFFISPQFSPTETSASIGTPLVSESGKTFSIIFFISGAICFILLF